MSREACQVKKQIKANFLKFLPVEELRKALNRDIEERSGMIKALELIFKPPEKK
jgi:hypothetical protein